ncbi:periplasmic heavy metal sensor [Hyalangium rubrum]|uniref:Periplasmic heavy metal sensor n=1 Tax=Hyalangium rubrum TaxID=3103134 RepID=A0ABU5HAI9_9BACT|nr:periplasmic heavy metal sensor [Hyalangium sp. s54d21]MDY7230496.1 periplasmic heavy metal sensor [Hyalangium sp. s54d21]
MFGFLFGTACLAGLFYTLRGGPWRHRHHGRGGGRWGMRGNMRWLFERLDTSPGQEKVFVKAADELTEAFAKLKDELGPSRTAIAQALRGEQFDSSSMREVNARHDALIENLRETLRTSMSQIHEALDPRQRRELADLIEHGWGYGYRGHGGGCGGWRGGYRNC